MAIILTSHKPDAERPIVHYGSTAIDVCTFVMAEQRVIPGTGNVDRSCRGNRLPLFVAD